MGDKNKDSRLNVRIDSPSRKQLQRLADRRRWTVSNYLRWVIENHLRRALPRTTGERK